MNELTVPLDDNDRIEIGNELEKLFILQDRPINKDKKGILVEELCLTGYPKAAILAGMKSLMSEDLKSVKFVHLVDAIKDKMTYEDQEAAKCNKCEGRGIILMRNADKYQFSLACRCPNGQRYIGQGMARWNGQPMQESKRHGLLEIDPIFLMAMTD